MSSAEAQLSKPKKNRKFLVLYIIALFSAAAVIILLSYLYSTHVEQSAEELEESKQLSLSALQSVDKLKEDNTNLQEQLSEMETELSALKGELEEKTLLLKEQTEQNEETLMALADTQKALSELTILYNELLQGVDSDD